MIFLRIVERSTFIVEKVYFYIFILQLDAISFAASNTEMQRRKFLLLISPLIFLFVVASFRFHQINLNFQTSDNDVSPIHSTRNVLLRNCFDVDTRQLTAKFRFDPSRVSSSRPKNLLDFVRDKKILEIGGPSPLTWGLMNVYDVLKSVDIVNFASKTIWDSKIDEKVPVVMKNRTLGKYIIIDGADLRRIQSESYDVVLASHVLEHLANPLKALFEWLRVLRPAGFLILILPFKKETFDHRRDDTKFIHLIDDYRDQVNDADLTHLEEILRLHDLSRDPWAGSPDAFSQRSKKNYENRALHQHVFSQELLYQVFTCLNIEIKSQNTWDIHQLIIGQKK